MPISGMDTADGVPDATPTAVLVTGVTSIAGSIASIAPMSSTVSGFDTARLVPTFTSSGTW